MAGPQPLRGGAGVPVFSCEQRWGAVSLYSLGFSFFVFVATCHCVTQAAARSFCSGSVECALLSSLVC